MIRILVFVAYYLPGYKSGGPLRTISNMVEHLSDEFEFWIVTSDRDATDTEPYPNVKINDWNIVGKARVYYASPEKQTIVHFARLLRETPHDVVYLNSFFSAIFTLRPLILRYLGLVPNRPWVIAPRGEFSPGALSLKAKRKALYIAIVKAMGLYRDLLWQASSLDERENIMSVMGKVPIHVAPNMPPRIDPSSVSLPRRIKRPNQARFIFLSRITPKKNLDYLLNLLMELPGDVSLSIVGLVDDLDYWRICQQSLQHLPSNVSIDVVGVVPHDKVFKMLSRCHFFVLPTLGENFGHAILEAMEAGLPVVISDRTPWRGLAEKQVGWDIPLEDRSRWYNVLKRCVDMGQQEYDLLSRNARNFVIQWSSDDDLFMANRELFWRLIRGKKEAS